MEVRWVGGVFGEGPVIFSIDELLENAQGIGYWDGKRTKDLEAGRAVLGGES